MRTTAVEWLSNRKRIFRYQPAMCGNLILPEAFEAIRRERRVTDCRGDRVVAEVVLDCPGVLTVICELVAAGMAKHVTVDEEWNPAASPARATMR